MEQAFNNDQTATTLRFFNPSDTSALTPEQITDPAKNLAADYVVSAEEIQTGANAVKPFAGGVTPPGVFGIVKNLFMSLWGSGSVELESWSTDTSKFTKQLTDRFGAAARNGVSNAFRTRYDGLKLGD